MLIIKYFVEHVMIQKAAVHQMLNTQRCNYRYATRADLTQIMLINNQFEVRWTEEKFIEIFDNNVPMLLAFDEQELLIGYCVYFCVLDEGRIINLAIDQKQQGKSYGRQLLHRSLDDIVDMNMHYALLDVKTDNYPAISLYTKMGFQILCRRPNYYPEQAGDAYFMQLAL